MTKENKTIGITLRFWTNDLEVKREGKKVNSCWDSGMCYIEANKEKGIKACCVPFNNFTEIPNAINKAIKKQKILMVKAGGN